MRKIEAFFTLERILMIAAACAIVWLVAQSW
jgi:hypothetical protein